MLRVDDLLRIHESSTLRLAHGGANSHRNNDIIGAPALQGSDTLGRAGHVGHQLLDAVHSHGEHEEVGAKSNLKGPPRRYKVL